MRHIERRSYLKRLENVRGVPDIKVLPGIRGSGKTWLIRDLARQLSVSDPDANIIRVSLRDSPELRDYGALHSFAEELFAHGDESIPESFVIRTAEEKDILRFEFFDEDILGTIHAGKTAGIVRIHFRHPLGGICDIDVMSAVRHKKAPARTECFIGDGPQQIGCEGPCYTAMLLIKYCSEMSLHAAVADKEHRFVWLCEQELAQLGYIAAVCQTQRSLRSFQDFRH